MSNAKFFLPVLCLASSLATARAATLIWDSKKATGAWEADNWFGTQIPPGPADIAKIQEAVAMTVATDHTVQGLETINSTGTISLTSSTPVTILAAAFGGVGGASSFSGSGTLTFDRVTFAKASDGLGSVGLFQTTLRLLNGGGFSLGSTASPITLSAASARDWNSGIGSGTGSFSLLVGSDASVIGGNTISLGNSATTFSAAGTLGMSAGTLSVGAGAGSLSGTLNFTSASSATFQNSGTMTVGALTVGDTSTGGTDVFANTGTLTAGSAGVNFQSGGYSIHNSGTLHLVPGGTVAMNAPFTQSGGTLDLASPTLALGSTMTISGGAMIGNLSASSGSGALVFGSGATLSPGATAGAIGSIAFPAALSMGAGSTLSIDIAATGSSDQITAGAAFDITGATLLLTRGGGSVSLSDSFTILSGGTRTGTFGNASVDGAILLASGSGGSFAVHYGDNSVTVTAVPEPGGYAVAVGLGLVGLGGWRRLRRGA